MEKMSDCKKTEKLISILAEGRVDKLLLHEVEQHINICEECRKKLEAARSVDTVFSLHTPLEDSFKDHFDSALHMRLAEESEKFEKPGTFSFFRYLSLFSAAAVLLFVITFSYQYIRQDEEPVEISRSVVESGRPVTVKLKYIATRAVENINVTIDLGEGLFFHSSRKKIRTLKKHVWKGGLKKGVNEIPFIVDVKKIGKWKIKTRADFEGYTHKHNLVLTADEMSIEIVYYEFPKVKIGDAS